MPTRLRSLALAGVLAAPLAVILAAVPAEAAINSPSSSGVVYTQDTTINISATAKAGGQSSLSIIDPAGASRVVDGPKGSTTQSASFSYQFDTGCYPDCGSGRQPALNGNWTVSLSGTEADKKTFTVRIPPAAPSNVRATVNDRVITVSWARGAEPDLTGWTVTDGNGTTLRDGLSSSACSSTGTCSTDFTYAANDQGQRTFAVIAHRSACPGCSNTLASPQSATASGTLAPPPPPSPTPQPTPSSDPGSSPGGGSGSGTGTGTGTGTSGTGTGTGTGTGSTTGSGTGQTTSSGSNAGGSSTSGRTNGNGTGSAISATSTRADAAQAQRAAFALSFSTFQPKLGIAKLPPLPATLSPVLAGSDETLADGSFQRTLGYKNVVQHQQVPVFTAAGRAVGQAVSGALDSAQFMRSLAGALVLLLAAAHLRRWLAQGARHR